MVNEDETLAELNTAATEYHSPVSVLDSSVHTEDAPTPTKQMVNSFRGKASTLKYSKHLSASELII